MSVLCQKYIADEVTKRFGIGFEGGQESFDGENLMVVRPRDLKSPNGFAIALSKTTRVIEATFKADNFSGGLLRKMGDVDQEKVADFISAMASLEQDCSIEFSVNGETTSAYTDCFTGALWKKVEFICELRLNTNVKGDHKLLNKVASELVTNMLSALLILMEVEEREEVVPLFEGGLPEGAKKIVEVNKYERSPVNRARCLEHHGFSCVACEMNFADVYGPIGAEFIEVHHVVPVSKMGPDYIVDPIKDLVPLCSNCHSIAHRRDPPLTVEDIRALLLDREDVIGERRLIKIEDVGYE